jgi:AMIN domain
MLKQARVAASAYIALLLCAAQLPAQSVSPVQPASPASSQKVSVPQVAVRQIKVLKGHGSVEIEVETSDRVTPQTQVLTGPDRLVIDLPNAVPGPQVRSQSVYRGDVKDVRVGLFQSNPPVTRIVLDLTSAQAYQVFPYGRTVMIKVQGDSAGDEVADSDNAPAPQARAGLVTANYTTGSERISDSAMRDSATPRSVLDVTFRKGMLSIHANKATLSDVLYAVQQRTGAEVAIASGADQEKVAVDLGPGPAAEVLSQLLNGSKFNFMILSAENNPLQIERVILSPKNDVVVTPFPQSGVAAQRDDEDDEAPLPPTPVRTPPVTNAAPTNNPPSNNPGANGNNSGQPDNKPTGDENQPQ